MHKRLVVGACLVALSVAVISLIFGCLPTDSGSSSANLYDWDLSACWGGGFDTCWELFTDNSDLIVGEQNFFGS